MALAGASFPVGATGKGKMSEQRFETNKRPHIHVSRCQGNLLISGRMGQAVDVSGPNFRAEQVELDELVVTSEDELDVRVPSDSSLTLDQVQGEIIIKHVTGHLTVKETLGEIHLKNLCSVAVQDARHRLTGENVDGPITIVSASGGVEMRNVGTLQIEQANGELQIQYVTGSVDIGQAEGSLNLHSVSGDLNVTKLDGDAQLSNLGGHNNLPDVSGRIHLAGSLSSGEHNFAAGDDVIVLWPFDAPVSLIATASEVRCLLDLENKVEGVSEEQLTTLTGHIEEGQAILILKTPAKIGIKPTYDSGAEPPEPAEFVFDFQPVPATPKSDAAPSAPLPGTESPPVFSEQLSDAITSRLRQAGLEMNPIQLKQLVSAAVATTLLDMPDLMAALSGELVARHTPGQTAAESARQAVETSLRQAKKSMDRIRRRGQPEAGHDEPTEAVSLPSVKDGPPPIPADEKMVTEDQLNILNLLREGHITAPQAKTLLDALEK